MMKFVITSFNYDIYEAGDRFSIGRERGREFYFSSRLRISLAVANHNSLNMAYIATAMVAENKSPEAYALVY